MACPRFLSASVAGRGVDAPPSSFWERQITYLTYRTVVKRWPSALITPRQGARVIHDSQRTADNRAVGEHVARHRCGAFWSFSASTLAGYFRMQSPTMPVAVPHLAPAAAP